MIIDYFKFVPTLWGVSGAIYFCWIWSAANELHKKVPAGLEMKLRKFKAMFLSVVICFIIMMIFASRLIVFLENMITNDGMLKSFDTHDIRLIGVVFIFIIPIYLFFLFGMIYSFYFVAKTIKTIEIKREADFSDYAGEFFLIWFFPIGVWILQPKINKIMIQS